MAEETLTEALSRLDDDNINKAALPENRRVEDEALETPAVIELSEEDVDSVLPITDDSVQEDFVAPEEPVAEEGTEAERRMRTTQGRINKAVKQAKDYQRRELQALQYAKDLQSQNKNLQAQITQNQFNSANQNIQIQENYTGEFENRINTQADAAKRSIRTAHEAGDSEAMAEAQQMLAQAEADRSSLNQYKKELDRYQQDYAAWAKNQEQEQAQNEQASQQTQQQQPVYSEPSDKAQDWASKNEWFGTDQVMTNVAFAIHTELQKSGVDLESDEYYSQIDARIRQELPQRFESNNARNSGSVQTVVSGTRTTGNGRNQNNRTIELTPSEQTLARKLGVPFKEYAKQKLRLQQS